MTWSIQNLWLIPVLPLLAMDKAGAERRQKVAHGVSRGTEIREIPVGMKAANQNRFLSPLTGLGPFSTYFYPRLTPWAAICRHSAASAHRAS
jgi:hypothetical protein